jgi:carboxylate-amine ligase
MDAQSTVDETAALVAFVQSLVRLELEEGFIAPELLQIPEVLEENRFLAARDGMEAELIDPVAERRVPVRTQIEPLLEALAPHAYALGCHEQLQGVRLLAANPGSAAQLAVGRRPKRLRGLVECLSEAFCETSPDVARLDREGC